MLSVIIPAYNEEQMLGKTSKIIPDIMEREAISYEIIFVDDGSGDDTWMQIEKASAENRHIRGIRFSRNFGKESAMFAGLEEARGDCVVVIDCDLQHPPEKIVEMYRLWEQGYEIIEGVKRSRGKESGLRAFAARTFYKLISDASGINMANASDFKLLDRKAVNVLRNMKEKNAFFRALSSWVGFKTIQIEYDVAERQAGESKWSTIGLIRYAITNITSYTTLPMQIVTILGSILLMVSVVLTVIALAQKAAGSALGGFTTVIVLQCFTSSVIMLSLGIIGYYIAKIYEELKGRPRYIIAEETGNEKQSVHKNSL